MSLIGKNPFVNEVLTSCSAEQLTSLSALINNLGSPTVIKLKELKNTDKGVKYASVFLDDFTLVHGLWIYTNTKCGLFAFQNGFDEMQAIRIDTVNKNYEYVYQHLSVTEFRSTLDDVANAGSGGGSGDLNGLVSADGKKIIISDDESTQVKKLVIDAENARIFCSDKQGGGNTYQYDWNLGTEQNYLGWIYVGTIKAHFLQDSSGNEMSISDFFAAGSGAVYKHDVTVTDSNDRTFYFSYYSSSPSATESEWDMDGYSLKNCSGILYDSNNNPQIAVIRSFDDFEGGGYVLYLMYDGVDLDQDYGEFSVQSFSETVYQM